MELWLSFKYYNNECIPSSNNKWQALTKGGISRKPKKKEFFMLKKATIYLNLVLKYWRVKPSMRRENWQLNWAVFSKAIELDRENIINWISTSGIINVSVYLTAYSLNRAAAFLTATNEVLRRVLFSFQRVSQHVLSESLATLFDVAINFQPEVGCRLHAIVSKLCRFSLAACLKLRPSPVYWYTWEHVRLLRRESKLALVMIVTRYAIAPKTC